MNPPRYPAAYLRTGSRAGALAMSRAAAQRGWPDPDLYIDGPDAASPGPALEEVTAAIAAGRHDGLLLAVPPTADPAMLRLLASCTAQGVTVSFVPLADAGLAQQHAAGSAVLTAPSSRAPVPTLMRARLDALTDLFPAWRIWADSHGWHARRRNGYMQLFRPGVPAFYVRADDATELAAQLCWQQAVDAHFPQGCARGKLAEEAGLPARWGALAP
ncbi:MAG TPA: hypothetical protein VEL03_22040 [Streptosporangiaceae bacterium]|nr:hypothetical protein [Streptosporangiaceae bacterium]